MTFHTKADFIPFPGGGKREYRIIQGPCRAEGCEEATVYGIEIVCGTKRIALDDIRDERKFVEKIMRKMMVDGAADICAYAEAELDREPG